MSNSSIKYQSKEGNQVEIQGDAIAWLVGAVTTVLSLDVLTDGDFDLLQLFDGNQE